MFDTGVKASAHEEMNEWMNWMNEWNDKDPIDVLPDCPFSGDQAETEYTFSCPSGNSLFLYTETLWHLLKY